MIKIITDSSSDIINLKKEYKNVSLKSIPLVVRINNIDYIDDNNSKFNKFMEDMENCKNPITSACPSPDAYVKAAEDSDEIIMITITSEMSGSYNAANIAKDILLEENPDKKIHIIDSLNVSSGNALIIDKIIELAENKKTFEEICEEIEIYKNKSKLIFALFSVSNLIKNGRIPKIIGNAIDLLKLILIGKNSKEGKLEQVSQCKTLKKALNTIFTQMKKAGYDGGKVIIHHCCNEEAAIKLKEIINNEFKNANIVIDTTKILCSFYAERKGFLVGYEIS